MVSVRRALAVAGLAAVLAVCLVASGCKGMPQADKLHPVVSPPAVREAGTLRAGVDLSTPPFGGTDAGKQAGIDLDVAAALASRLGLKLAVVDLKRSDAATSIASGRVDVVMSMPYSSDALSQVALAGSYIANGPAFFVTNDSTASAAATIALDRLPDGTKVGAQQGSAAYWALVSALGSDATTSFPTLRDALAALQKGEVQVVGGDAITGAYIARDMPTVRYAGQIEPAQLVGIGVATENTTLEDAVRKALDGLAADGILDAVRSKWVGNLPRLDVPTSLEATGTTTSTPAP